MVERERATLEILKYTEREHIETNRHYPDAPYWKMAVRFGQLELEAHLRWAEETLAELRRITKKQQRPTEDRKGTRDASK
jgi:hypothetical protein